MGQSHYTSRQRIQLAIQHHEPDHVPLDLGSSAVTGMHVQAYRKLRKHLGLEPREAPILDLYQQTVVMHEDLLQMLHVDTRGILPSAPRTWNLSLFEKDGYECFVNEWGVTWRKPTESGYYYDPIEHPLAGQIDRNRIDRHPWPDPTDPTRFKGMKEQADRFNESLQPALVVEGAGGELFDTLFWVRGPEDTYMDFIADPNQACYLMDKLGDYQLQYWERVINELDEPMLILRFGDDLGDQRGTRISPEMYRKYIKPRHKRLIAAIKEAGNIPVYFLLHSCGSVYDIIPDFIEVGFDILNPVQVSAANMDSARLKKEFGKDIAFWGGGVDTQSVLPYGTPQQVKDEVKMRIDHFAPGGGFVFNPVHNIQFDVPPENVVSMWEAWRDYGSY